MLRGSGLVLVVQRLESGAPRAGLDVPAGDRGAGVARLRRVGAERVPEMRAWPVMRDRAGLPWCVLPVRPGSLEQENARRWECS